MSDDQVKKAKSIVLEAAYHLIVLTGIGIGLMTVAIILKPQIETAFEKVVYEIPVFRMLLVISLVVLARLVNIDNPSGRLPFVVQAGAIAIAALLLASPKDLGQLQQPVDHFAGVLQQPLIVDLEKEVFHTDVPPQTLPTVGRLCGNSSDGLNDQCVFFTPLEEGKKVDLSFIPNESVVSPGWVLAGLDPSGFPIWFVEQGGVQQIHSGEVTHVVLQPSGRELFFPIR